MISEKFALSVVKGRIVVSCVICFFCLLVTSSIPSFAAGADDPPVIGNLCTTETVQIRSPDDYKKFMGQLESFLILAPHLPDYPNKCLLSLPVRVWQTVGQIQGSQWKTNAYGSYIGAISTVVWYYASYALLPRASSTQVPADIDSALVKALGEAYSDNAIQRDCLVSQYHFAKSYAEHILGKRTEKEALNFFQQFASAENSDTPCRLPFFYPTDRPPLFGEAISWGDELVMEDFASRSLTDKSFLTKLYLAVSGASREGKRRFVQHEMLTDPILVPSSLTPGSKATVPFVTNVHLAGSLTAGDAPLINLDKNLGPSVLDHQEDNDWYNRDYGEVYSQSDLHILSAQPIDAGHLYGYSIKISSFVRGGYDPPWPGKTIHTRGAHDYVSVLDYDVTTTVDISDCQDNDANCFPQAQVSATVSDDKADRGVVNTVELLQNKVPVVGEIDDLGSYHYKLNRSLGAATLNIHLKRKDTHTGALGAPPVEEQLGQVFVDSSDSAALGYHQFEYKGALDRWLRHYDRPMPPGDDSDIESKLGFALAHYPTWEPLVTSDSEKAVRANDRYDLYLRLYWARRILEADSAILSVADKQAIEKAQRILSGLARSLYLGETRRQIETLKGFALDVSTEDLDLALASLLEALPNPSAAAVNRLGAFQEHNRKVLPPEMNELITALRAAPDSKADANALMLEASLEIIQLKASISHLRDTLGDELLGNVIELARLEADCATVLSEYSQILGRDLSTSGLFSCPKGKK
jgi:hypothetical protein